MKNNSETRKIIAFAGRKRSGKTTLANVIKDYEKKAKIITIADYLKKLCSQLMGMSYEELNVKKTTVMNSQSLPMKNGMTLLARLHKSTKI